MLSLQSVNLYILIYIYYSYTVCIVSFNPVFLSTFIHTWCPYLLFMPEPYICLLSFLAYSIV